MAEIEVSRALVFLCIFFWKFSAFSIWMKCYSLCWLLVRLGQENWNGIYFFFTEWESHVTITAKFAWVNMITSSFGGWDHCKLRYESLSFSGLFEQVSAGKGCHGVCQKNCSWVSQCNSESLAVIKTFTSWPISLPDLISNCPYCVLCNSYDVVWEILVLDQVIIPLIDIFLYSHHLSAWYCTDLWGETLSWSLTGVKG